MLKSLFATFVVAGGLMLAGAATPASAGVAVPEIAGNTPSVGLPIEHVHWRCGPYACHWVPNYWGPRPYWARRWGPPPRPGCYWKRGKYGQWKIKCPH